jgi:hypothetical protein
VYFNDYFFALNRFISMFTYPNQYLICMKTNYLPEGMVKKNYLCSLLGHRFVETKKVNNHFSEFKCEVCKLQATNDSRGHKITLTSKLKEINETLFYLQLKKQFIAHFYFTKKE